MFLPKKRTIAGLLNEVFFMLSNLLDSFYDHRLWSIFLFTQCTQLHSWLNLGINLTPSCKDYDLIRDCHSDELC